MKTQLDKSNKFEKIYSFKIRQIKKNIQMNLQINDLFLFIMTLGWIHGGWISLMTQIK